MTKLLILSSDTGEGHNSAAAAIENAAIDISRAMPAAHVALFSPRLRADGCIVASNIISHGMNKIR